MGEPALSPAGSNPTEFVAAVLHPVRRKDAESLLNLMAKVTGKPPAMWGPPSSGSEATRQLIRDGYDHITGHQRVV